MSPITPTATGPAARSSAGSSEYSGLSLPSVGALPRPVRTWTLTTLREKLVKIGAKVVRHAKAVTFQLAEVAVPRALSVAILGRIGGLRAAPSPG